MEPRLTLNITIDLSMAVSTAFPFLRLVISACQKPCFVRTSPEVIVSGKVPGRGCRWTDGVQTIGTGTEMVFMTVRCRPLSSGTVERRSRNLVPCNAVASDTVIWCFITSWDRLGDNAHRLRQSIGSGVKIRSRKSFSIISIVFLAALYSQLTITPLSPHVTHHYPLFVSQDVL